ncbi:MAG: hypothetical protein ABS949_10960 [Solibacillus sp.]
MKRRPTIQPAPTGADNRPSKTGSVNKPSKTTRPSLPVTPKK